MLQYELKFNELEEEYSTLINPPIIFVGSPSNGVISAIAIEDSYKEVFDALWENGTINQYKFTENYYPFNYDTNEETDLTEGFTETDWKQAIEDFNYCYHYTMSNK